MQETTKNLVRVGLFMLAVILLASAFWGCSLTVVPRDAPVGSRPPTVEIEEHEFGHRYLVVKNHTDLPVIVAARCGTVHQTYDLAGIEVMPRGRSSFYWPHAHGCRLLRWQVLPR